MSEQHRPLVVMQDEALLDEVLRLAAAAGCEVEVAPDPPAARGSWLRAPPVLVDGTALQAGLRGQVPARSGVALGGRGQPPGGRWRAAVPAGAAQGVAP